MDDNVQEIDKFEPNYKGKCCNCDQSPTVTAVKDGKVVVDWEMCGPCTFGTAQAIDPLNWNDLD